MEATTRPKVLFVYYSYTQQTSRVVKAMSEAFRGRGAEVVLARIELTDPRYADKFQVFPLRRPYLDVFAMIPSALRKTTGTIRIPAVVTEWDYDLVCIGSPTWWFFPAMPVRSFLASEAATRVLKGNRFAAAVLCRRYWQLNLKTVERLGVKCGGIFVGGIHFAYEGGQIRSMLSLISYLGSGEYRQRYLGVKIKPTNLRDHQLDEARLFADQLANQLFATVA
jgi:hypothetical protein